MQNPHPGTEEIQQTTISIPSQVHTLRRHCAACCMGCCCLLHGVLLPAEWGLQGRGLLRVWVGMRTWKNMQPTGG